MYNKHTNGNASFVRTSEAFIHRTNKEPKCINVCSGKDSSMYALFAICCLLSVLLITRYMPETKSESYEQIMESLQMTIKEKMTRK